MESSNESKCVGEDLALASHAVRLSPGEPGFFDKLAELLASFSDCEEVKISCEIDGELHVIGRGKPLAATLTSRRFKESEMGGEIDHSAHSEGSAQIRGDAAQVDLQTDSVTWNLLDSAGAFLGQLSFLSLTPMSPFRDKLNLYEFWQNLVSRELEVFRKNAELKKIEADREELEGQLIRVQKIDAMNLFASGVAHDLNNLLTPLFGYVSLLKTQASISGEGRRYLSEIESISRRAKELTQEILLKAKNQEGPTQAFSVQDLLREVEAQLKVVVPEKITMSFEFPAEEIVLDGRSVELHQILTNLTQNALQAMSERGGVLTVHASVASGSSRSEGKTQVTSEPSLRLEVRDTGIGIDEKISERIFMPFFSTRPDRGSGLGLSVVQSLVQKNRGNLAWSSVPGKGTVFEILLPIVAPSDDQDVSVVTPSNDRGASAEENSTSDTSVSVKPVKEVEKVLVAQAAPSQVAGFLSLAHENLHTSLSDVENVEFNKKPSNQGSAVGFERSSSRPRVMVVDDEASIGKMCVEFLQLYDIEVFFYTDGETALANFSRNPLGYDLLLTDFSMPKMTGEQLIQKFYEIRSGMPFILMSGDQFHFDQGFEFGVTQVFRLMKPFDFNALPNIIRDLIEKSQQKASV